MSYHRNDDDDDDHHHSQRQRQRRQLNSGGRLKNLVILLRFADHVNRTLPSPADIDILMNHEGPHELCPTGSVRDVLLENSYGALRLDSAVTDWVVLNQTEAYYSNGVSGRSTRIWEAVRYALEYLDDNHLVDWHDFDQDQDGRIDSIALVHSGYGAEWGGTDQDGTFYDHRIWSHKWSLYEDPFVSRSGVQVQDYHLSPGLWGRSGKDIGRIGVIAHETGHFLGIPGTYPFYSWKTYCLCVE
jgi:M6 family metalloprotease-like protein